jgi:hypothetical protein
MSKEKIGEGEKYDGEEKISTQPVWLTDATTIAV